MENINLPENYLYESELQQLTVNLLSFIDADSVYISFVDIGEEPKTIISLFVKKDSIQTSEELYNVTAKLFTGYPQFAYRIFDFDWAEYSLRKGNPFFMRHCSGQELVYSEEEHENIFNPTAAKLQHLIKKARKRYVKDMHEIEDLGRELPMYLRNGNHLQAAYILQQTIRRLYYTASWFLAGESIPSQRIAEQQEYIRPFSGVLGRLFDLNNIQDAVLLENLDSAFEAVRENTHMLIGSGTVSAAVAKVAVIQEAVGQLFEETVRVCEEKFAADSDRGELEEEVSGNKVDTEMTVTDLQELATRHFKKLRPDVKLEGVYAAEVKFIGYADLMCFATDLIKLCVTAHSANEELGYGDVGLIVNPKVNIANILEVVIQLLPLHEAEYLDILAELFAENQKKHQGVKL